MSTRELLKRYNEAFADVMSEKHIRLRLSAAIRALTLAEVMRDPERMIMAATTAHDLFFKLERGTK